MIIQIEDLHKQYDKMHALQGIDLNISEGGIIGLLGPNGAGKTTLVETIEGLRMPTSGKISVLGLNPQKSPQALKSRIGVQLQSTSLPKELTPAETLKLFAAFFDKSEDVASILDRVDLTEKSKTYNRNLSGGQQQRLAIGMALINDPELIILDEPSTGLDPVARRSIHDIISGLREQGRSIILTTHYIEEAEKLCDRVIIIRAGKIVADGSPFDLVNKAAGASTIWIAVDGELDATPLLNAGATSQGNEGAYYRFTTTNPTSAVLALGEILKAQELTLTDLRMKRPTLEDVYLEVIGKAEDVQ